MQSYIYIYIYLYIYGPTTLVSSHYIAWSEFIGYIHYFLYTCTSSFFNRHFAPVPANPRPQGPWLHDWIQHQWHVGDPKVICILGRGGKTYSKNMAFCNMHFSEFAMGWKYAFFLGKMHIFCIFSVVYSYTFPGNSQWQFHQYAFLRPWKLCKKYCNSLPR